MTDSDIKNRDGSTTAQDMAAIRKQAAAWAARLHSGAVTAGDRRRFGEWYGASADNCAAFRRLDQSWTDLDYATLRDPDLEREFNRLRVKRPPERRVLFRKPSWAMALSVAASVVLAVGLSLALLQIWGDDDIQRHVTATGEIRTVTLEDGSRITLAGATTLVTDFTASQRRADLVRGQAYFDVARDPDRQFLIRAGESEIQVLGTEFDVQKTSADVRISVVEGLVGVVEAPAEDIEGGRLRRKLDPPPALQLQGGEQVHVARDGTLGAVKPFEAHSLLAWREGKFIYNNTPLVRIIDEVNRYRRVKIILADDVLADMPVTIAFSAQQTEHLFDGLELTGVVEIIRSPESVIIRAKAQEIIKKEA